MTTTTTTITYLYYYFNVPEGGEVYTENMPGDVDWKNPGYDLGAVSDDAVENRADGGGAAGGVGGGGRSGGGVVVGGIGGEDGDRYHESVHERGFVNSANIGIVITVCNIALNILLLVLVMLRRSTRLQFVYQQVMNLAFSDLAFSVIVDPFTIYFELQPWRLGPGFCVAWMVLDSALPFVSFLILITLNADRFLFAVSPGLYHRVSRRLPLRLLCLLLPWTAGLGVVVPLWMLSAVAWPQQGLCIYGVTKKAAMASSVLSLYLPCVALIVLTVLVLVTIIGGMPEDPCFEPPPAHGRAFAVARRPPPPLPQAGGAAGAACCVKPPRLTAVIKQEGGGGAGSASSQICSSDLTNNTAHRSASYSSSGSSCGTTATANTTTTYLPSSPSLSAPPAQLSNGPHSTGGSNSLSNAGNLQIPTTAPTTPQSPPPYSSIFSGGGSRLAAAGGGGGGGGPRRREEACGGSGDGRPVMKKGHRSLVVALCVVNLLTVITQLPYGAITMLEPECVEHSCQSTIKLIQALSWMRSVTFSLHPFCLIAMTAIRDTCCCPFGRGSSGFDPRCAIRDDPTASGNTNSEHMELASVNAAGVHIPHTGPSTML